MILVTGATGRLGAALVHCLRKRSLPFAGVSGPNTRSEDSSIRFSADLADRGDVERVFGEIRPTAVIHAAALTDLDKCESNPAMAWSANTTSADNVAGVCAARGARLILISTDGVFEGRTGNYDETAPNCPINQYAITKLAGEQAALHRCRAALVVRTNFVGSRDARRPGLVEWIRQRLEAGLDVPGFTDAVFSPLHSDYLADLLLDLIETDLEGIFHVASHDSSTKFDFARRLAEWLGFDSDLVKPALSSDASFTAERPKNLSLNATKIERELGRQMPLVQEVIETFARSPHLSDFQKR